MVWTNTGRVIAAMENEEAARVSVVEYPRIPMRSDFLLASPQTHPSVTITVWVVIGNPTAPFTWLLFYVTPKCICSDQYSGEARRIH